MNNTSRFAVLVLLSTILVGTDLISGQDWPQWRGPNRDDKVTGFSAPANWPKQFIQKWKVTIGLGVYKLVRSPEVFEREFRVCEKAGGGGCAIFHYGSLLKNAALGSFLSRRP